jgi:hypothetical protein
MSLAMFAIGPTEVLVIAGITLGAVILWAKYRGK